MSETRTAVNVDVLCLGHACFDLIFEMDHHPGPDEKSRAKALHSCGGGTAANAAMSVARLGYQAAFAGYLGNDIYGDEHCAELAAAGVHTDLVARGPQATPLSAILVKPDGRRTIVNFKGETNFLDADTVPLNQCLPKVLLLDGHQPELATAAVEFARARRIPVVLDADTINEGNVRLIRSSDHVVASERFSLEFTGEGNVVRALRQLHLIAPQVVVTMGETGLIWQRHGDAGHMPAFAVDVVDTTGAGDTFHGAFAAGLAAGMPWELLLRFASAAGALCCTRFGARLGIPSGPEVHELLRRQDLKVEGLDRLAVRQAAKATPSA